MDYKSYTTKYNYIKYFVNNLECHQEKGEAMELCRHGDENRAGSSIWVGLVVLASLRGDLTVRNILLWASAETIHSGISTPFFSLLNLIFECYK
jgi:hypothetical protein